MEKENKTLEEINKDIEEFITFSKDNNKTYETKREEIEKKYNVKIESECEYYTATLNGKGKINLDGELQDIEYELNYTSDWNACNPELDDYEHNIHFEGDDEEDYQDEFSDFMSEEMSNFANEYAEPFEAYYDNMTKFWSEKGYSVDYDDISMSIWGYGYDIRTSNWNHENMDDFEVEKNED